ncbi:hypothetical protein HMI56_007455 [Coelomomyces lativittatus]|nr:hypothetical protein HMI56_007455 [Coelomomyces lativittatus]
MTPPPPPPPPPLDNTTFKSKPTSRSSPSHLDSILEYHQTTLNRLFLQYTALKKTLLQRQLHLKQLQEKKKKTLEPIHLTYVHHLNEHQLRWSTLQANLNERFQTQPTSWTTSSPWSHSPSFFSTLRQHSQTQFVKEHTQLNAFMKVWQEQVQHQVVQPQETHALQVLFCIYIETLHTWLGLQLEAIQWSVYYHCLQMNSSSSSSTFTTSYLPLPSARFLVRLVEGWTSLDPPMIETYRSLPRGPFLPLPELRLKLKHQVQQTCLEPYAKSHLVDPFLHHVFEQQQRLVKEYLSKVESIYRHWVRHATLLKIWWTWIDLVRNPGKSSFSSSPSHLSSFVHNKAPPDSYSQLHDFIHAFTPTSSTRTSKGSLITSPTTTSMTSWSTFFLPVTSLAFTKPPRVYPFRWSMVLDFIEGTPHWTHVPSSASSPTTSPTSHSTLVPDPSELALAQWEDGRHHHQHTQRYHRSLQHWYVETVRQWWPILTFSYAPWCPSRPPVQLAELATLWTLRIKHVQGHGPPQVSPFSKKGVGQDGEVVSQDSEKEKVKVKERSAPASSSQWMEEEEESQRIQFLLHRMASLTNDKTSL